MYICIRMTYICIHISFAEYRLFYKALLHIYVTYICIRHTYTYQIQMSTRYGVAMVSRIDKIICLFCRMSSLL